MKMPTCQRTVIDKKAVPTKAPAKPKLNVLLEVVKKPVSPGAFDC